MLRIKRGNSLNCCLFCGLLVCFSKIHIIVRLLSLYLEVFTMLCVILKMEKNKKYITIKVYVDIRFLKNVKR